MRRTPVLAVLAALILCGASLPPEQPKTDASSPACGDHGPLPRPCSVIVFDGDSISAGGGAVGPHGLDIQFMQALATPARVYNVAVGGRPVADCLARFGQNVVPLKHRGARPNLIVFHAGDNDIARGSTAAQTYDAFTRYVALAHAHGWKVVVSTEMPRPDFRPDQERELDAYNRQLIANKARADVVVDFNADARFGDLAQRNGSPIFIEDWIHPNNAGYAILGQRLATAVRPLLPR